MVKVMRKKSKYLIERVEICVRSERTYEKKTRVFVTIVIILKTYLCVFKRNEISERLYSKKTTVRLNIRL